MLSGVGISNWLDAHTYPPLLYPLHSFPSSLPPSLHSSSYPQSTPPSPLGSISADYCGPVLHSYTIFFPPFSITGLGPNGGVHGCHKNGSANCSGEIFFSGDIGYVKLPGHSQAATMYCKQANYEAADPEAVSPKQGRLLYQFNQLNGL